AGSIGINQIRNNTQALVGNGSTLTTDAGSGAGVSVAASDDSWINSTAGAVAVAIAVSQKTAVGVALGVSLTINSVENTTRAAVVDSDIASDGTVAVTAESHSRIDSLAFGIAVAVAISGNA